MERLPDRAFQSSGFKVLVAEDDGQACKAALRLRPRYLLSGGRTRVLFGQVATAGDWVRLIVDADEK